MLSFQNSMIKNWCQFQYYSIVIELYKVTYFNFNFKCSLDLHSTSNSSHMEYNQNVIYPKKVLCMVFSNIVCIYILLYLEVLVTKATQ